MKITDIMPGDILVGKYDDGRVNYVTITDKAVLVQEYAHRTACFEVVRAVYTTSPTHTIWVETSRLKDYTRFYRDVNADIYDKNGNVVQPERLTRRLSSVELTMA